MAGDWIKLRTDLHSDPAVIRLAAVLSLDVFAVVGRLAAVWVWADTHADRHGRVTLVSRSCLDAVTQCHGFGEALEQVGWLESLPGDVGGIAFPRFERHMGGGAKARAQAAKRKQKQRERDNKHRHAHVTLPSRCDRDNSVTREEKSREEKKREEKTEEKPLPGPESVPIPEGIDTPEFRTAWGLWLNYRGAMPKKNRLTAVGAKLALKKLEPFGPAGAVGLIERAIANGWVGCVFDDKPTASGPPRLTGKPTLAEERAAVFEEFQRRRAAEAKANGEAA